MEDMFYYFLQKLVKQQRIIIKKQQSKEKFNTFSKIHLDKVQLINIYAYQIKEIREILKSA